MGNISRADRNFRFDGPKDLDDSLHAQRKTDGSNRRYSYDGSFVPNSFNPPAKRPGFEYVRSAFDFVNRTSDVPSPFLRSTDDTGLTPEERLGNQARELALKAVPDAGFGRQGKRAGLSELLDSTIALRERAQALAENDPERAAALQVRATAMETRLREIIDSGEYISRQYIYAASLEAQSLALGTKLLTTDIQDPLVQAQLERIYDIAQDTLEFLSDGPERPTFQQRTAIYIHLLYLDVQIDHLGEDLSSEPAMTEFTDRAEIILEANTKAPYDDVPEAQAWKDRTVLLLERLTELSKRI